MRGNLFVLSLVAPIVATVELATADIFRPFADATHVADVIRDAGLQDAPMIAIIPSRAQAVSAFLDRPMLYPMEGKTRTFVYWGTGTSYARIVRAADSATTALLARHCHVVLLASPSGDVSSETAARGHLLYATKGRPMSGDRYHVWVVSAPSSPRCPASGSPTAPPRSASQPTPSS